MPTPEPVTETIDASEAQAHWRELFNRVRRGETRVIVEEDGVPAVVIIAAGEMRRLSGLDTARRERFQALEATWAAFREVPDEEIEREVTRAIAEVREKHRQRQDPAPRSA